MRWSFRFRQTKFVERLFLRRQVLRGNGGIFLPAFEFGQQILNDATVRLIFNRRFQPPFVFLTPDFDLVVAILNYDSVNLLAVEIQNVLCLP